MTKTLIVLLAALSTPVFAASKDDPLLFKFMLDQFEVREADEGNPLVVEADAWIGKDINKAWFKADIERIDGEYEQLEFQALYSRAISAYWDFQAGWRHDAKPSDEKRDWAVLGFRGLAPYYFDIDASLYLGESGQTSLGLDAEYEVMLTQKWVLVPELQVNLFGKDDPDIGQGSGLSDIELGLRLRYEIRREFAPYIGVNWEKKFGQTADYAREEGEETSDLQFVVGFHAWF
ncbi:MAG: copper resistance protein B [bacterium]